MSTNDPFVLLPDPTLVALVECLLYVKVVDAPQVKAWARALSDSTPGTASDWIYEVAYASDDAAGHEHVKTWMSKAASDAISARGFSHEDLTQFTLAIIAKLFFAQPSEWPKALYSLEWARGCGSVPTSMNDAIYELWNCAFDWPLYVEYSKGQIQERLAQLLSTYRDRPIPDLRPIVPRLSPECYKVVAPD